MTMVIYKYVIDEMTAAGAGQVIKIPIQSRFLHLDLQYGKIATWWLVDTESQAYEHTLRVYGTGFSIDEDLLRMRYLGTVVLQSGALVLHVFDQFEIPVSYPTGKFA